MKKRIIISLILLFLVIAAVFADISVTVTVNITRTGSNGWGGGYKYTATVKSISPSSGITLTYSSSQNGTYYPATEGTIVLDAQNSQRVYFKASDGSYTSSAGSININSTGNKSVTLTIQTGSGTGTYSEEARLFYFPRSVVDNSNVLVNLASSHSMNASDFNENFVNYTDSNLALFRIRETLITEAVDTGRSSNLSESITITIESLDDWTFVNEYNSTRTTNFTLDAFCVEEWFEYITTPSKKTIVHPLPAIQLGATTTLGNSGDSATFKSVGDNYELELPYTYFQKGTGRYYPKFYRNADICLNIPEFGSGLEPGYYTTRLRVTIPDHYEADINGNKTYGFGRSFVITIRGYLGIDANNATGSSSFYVLSMENTYSMDLGIASNPDGGYAIANAKFQYFDVLLGPEGVQNAPNVLPANPQVKYTVYISSTSNYNDTSTPFRFIKIGSERQARTDDNTIYFRLAWESTNAAYDNQTTAPLYMRPKYTYRQISKTSSANTGRDSYQVNWEMDNVIKLYLTDQSLQTYAYHQEGMYYSYIYFTLVTN